ncbi:hypothetical protein TWF481_002081 [Arthrobotrys musiformis]|uniref:Ras-associating domain-containing protein n=1 Tax=Arthrobotrys musiformis TaxID=47236 RepID=A0AAV9VUL2_9PEZI
MNHRLLRDLNIQSVGHRISILNAIKDVKISYYPPPREEYVPPSAEAVCVPMTEYRSLESTARHYEEQIEGMSRQLKKSKEEASAAWRDLSVEIEKGVQAKTELLRLRRLNRRIYKDKGTQSDFEIIHFLSTMSDSPVREKVKKEDKENTFVGIIPPTGATRADLRDSGQQHQATDMPRGRRPMEAFDETTKKPFDTTPQMLKSILKAFDVEQGDNDWSMWVQYDGHRRELEPDEFPVKVCRELRNSYIEVFFLVRHQDMPEGHGYICTEG